MAVRAVDRDGTGWGPRGEVRGVGRPRVLFCLQLLGERVGYGLNALELRVSRPERVGVLCPLRRPLFEIAAPFAGLVGFTWLFLVAWFAR